MPKSEADSKYQQKGSFGFGGSGGTVIYKNNDEFFNWIRRSGASPEFFRNSADSDYTHTYGAGLLLKAGDTYASFSVNYATARVKVVAGNDAGTANSPIKELAFTDDSYTKSESDAKYQILGLTQIVSEYNVPWNANSGLYYSDFSTHSKLIVNFNIGVGSCPTLQLLANYRNGGLFYRSARDSYGFEENWAELLTVESANSRYIQDVRLGTEEHATLWRGYGYSDTPPYVITEVSNYNRDEFPDSVSRRPFQKLINGIWHNIGAL
ncbi:hypothetical protein Xsto_04073 [Xenorhabdus stockiae]|uniref:Uncharacterized protein n=1 Tax=Xenorhabdus stockiae TaxID=351614 RepID=A0A2D0K7C9_9GAMM|nr:hypothetical protein Xsto_04073 [Xenorhabdus stockiae]